MTDKRYRMQFRFWLDGNNDDQLILADYCERLKAEKRFAPTIRRALTVMLAIELRQWDIVAEIMPQLVQPSHQLTNTPQPQLEAPDDLPTIFSGDTANANETRENLQVGLGNMFADDDPFDD